MQPASGNEAFEKPSHPRRSRGNREAPEHGPLPDMKRPRRLSTRPAPDFSEPVSKARAKVDRFSPTTQMRNSDKLIKTLHAFLDFLPPNGQLSIARDIDLCGEDDAKLFEVFENLWASLLVPMKANSARPSVTSSRHPKRQAQVDLVASQLGAPTARSPAFRDICLIRDDYRCAITRDLDVERWEDLGRPQNDRKANLEAAHIIPFSFASYKDEDVPPKRASETWAMLYRCFPDLKGICNPAEINDPANGLMLSSSLHEEFGNFTFAFAATDVEHTYKLKVYPRFSDGVLPTLPDDRIVKFSTGPDATHIPLPNPIFLNVHFIIAEVLNASGMGYSIDELFRDLQDIGCLCEDGSTDISTLLSAGLGHVNA